MNTLRALAYLILPMQPLLIAFGVIAITLVPEVLILR